MKKIVLAAALAALTSCTEQREADNKVTAPEASTETNDAPVYDPALDITKVAPDMYKLLHDTLNMRVLEATYKPGDSSAVHAHPDFAMYVLEGGTVRITGQDGKSQDVEFKKGAGMVLPADTHSAKNIGKTTLKLVVVEVSRSGRR